MVLAHATVSFEAAGAGANKFQERRHCHCRRHDQGARRGLPGDLREGWWFLQRWSFHTIFIPRRRRAAEKHNHLPGKWWTQLGWYGSRSENWIRFRANARRRPQRLGREKTSRRKLWKRQRLPPTLRSWRVRR